MSRPIIEFEGTLSYKQPPGFPEKTPLAEVVLYSGDRRTGSVFAVLDTGSSVTVFQQELAGDLGIDDITAGASHIVISTGGGSITAYLFDVEMEVVLDAHTQRISCQVGFADRHIPRNILGQNLIFRLYTFAFREQDSTIYFVPT
jgi:predicted aspartyl protease